jgi:hypothetical protein
MTTTDERRDLALAELLPGLYALVLRHGQSEDKGYVLRRNMGIAEATLLMREILAPGNGTALCVGDIVIPDYGIAWLRTLLPQPWRVVVLEASQLRGVFNVVLPAKESGWPE